MDDAAGEYSIDTIYDDANPDQLDTIADTQLHRNVDLELLKADKEGASQLFSGSNYPILSFIRVCQDLPHPTLYDLWDR